MIAALTRTIRELGKPWDVLLFGLAGYVGIYLPFLFHVVLGSVFLPVPKEKWDTQGEGNNVRLVFVLAGCLAVIVPTIVSVLLLRKKTRSGFKRGVICGGLACGALATMLWLSPHGYAFILR